MTVELRPAAGRQWATSTLATLVAAMIAVPVAWNFRIDPLRRATESGLYANFFDLQARALLDGRLDVPRGSLGLEGFIVDGREYLYNAPLPALLRMPVHALSDAWFGRLTAVSLLVAWLVFAVATSVLVWRVRRSIVGDRPLPGSECWWWGGLIVAVTAGSPVLLLLAVPWVYAEALMWATAGTLAVLAAALGVLERPRARRLVALFLAALIAVLSRVTAAWPAALVVLLVAIVNARRRPLGAMRWHVAATVAAGVIPLALGVGFNMAKFDHPFAIPFDQQVWTSMSERRQEVLDDGGVAGARFLPTTLVAYGRPDGLRVSSVFPFISAPASAPSGLLGQTLDMTYRTPSVPAAMPALVLLGGVGLVRIVRRRSDPGHVSVMVPLVGAAFIPAGALLVGYLAPRYLVEFLPAVAVAAAAGLAALLDAGSRIWARWVRAMVVVLAVFGLLGNVAFAVWSANVRHAVEPLQRLVTSQLRLADLPLVSAPSVEIGGEPPRVSEPDTIFLTEGCEAAYYGTGDHYEPWAPIWMPRLVVSVAGGTGPDEPMSFSLIEIGRWPRVILDLDGDGAYRLRTVGAEGGFRQGGWYELDQDGAIITVTGASDWDTFLIDAPGHLYTGAPSVELFGDELRRRPIPATVVADDAALRTAGVDVTVDIEHPALCDDLRALARH